MNMTKSYAARYAQLRRYHEDAAREALESRIPSQHFSADIMGNGDYNKTTKVLMAMISYLENLQALGQADGNRNEDDFNSQVHKEVDNREKTPFFISMGMSRRKSLAEQIQHLRQVATRLVQKIEERLQGEESPSEELKETIEKANDLMIDMIAEVERNSVKKMYPFAAPVH